MSNPYSDAIVPGSWILEQLTLELPDIEMAAGRRAWHEATGAWPGQESRLWWKWTSEAASSIGLATKTIDCSLNEAMEVIRSGASIIVWGEAESEDAHHGHWLYIKPREGRKHSVRKTDGVAETLRRSPRKLRRLLKKYQDNGRIRCVVVRSDVSLGSDETRGLSPFSRLLTLMRPEWNDIWIVLVFAFVVGLLTLATPIAVEALVNTVAFGRFLQPVIVLAILLLTFLAFSAAMKALQTYVVEIVQRRFFARIAGDLAYRLPRARVDETDGVFLPELTNRFFDIVTVQKVTAQLLLDGVGLVLTAVIGMAVLAFYHPWLLGFDVIMMGAIAFIIVVLGRGAVGSAVKESKHKYNMASWLEDITRCPTTFRTAGGTDLALERSDRLIHEYLVARQKHFRILMRQVLFALGLQAVASTVLLGMGGWLVIAQQLTLGQLVAAELIVTVIVGAFAKLGKHLESFYDLLAAVDKLGVLFDIPTESQDGVLDTTATGPANVTVDAVQYRGQSGGSLLEAVSFTLPPQTSAAVVGRSGSGKSTLLDMIYGLRTPTSGHVTIDDFDPDDLRPDILRNHIALVRQSEVFHGTLEENVHLHRSNVTSADVRRATEAVGLYDQVLRLAEGFDTRINGSGQPLSQTQVDLLCLARAIAGRPRLLLVDGVLDRLPDEELETVCRALFAEDRTWSLIVTTGRAAVATHCEQTIALSPRRPTVNPQGATS